ncbi:MAG: Maf family protein [Synergistaceae bacterium]|nr:Maf family protein [Synergistaceae bacterium]
MARLILASGSPRRSELLSAAGFVFETVVPGIEELTAPGEDVRTMAARLAREKSVAVSRKYPDAWVIGADTVVDVDGEPFAKPKDKGDAVRMLGILNGRSHLVHTGVSIAGDGEARTSFVETTKVTFGSLSKEEITAFVESGLGLDKAGAYAIQSRGALLVERIEGCYYNVMGLPIYRLKKIFEKLAPDLLLF